jgi:hypothetical protein
LLLLFLMLPRLLLLLRLLLLQQLQSYALRMRAICYNT